MDDDNKPVAADGALEDEQPKEVIGNEDDHAEDEEDEGDVNDFVEDDEEEEEDV